MPLGPDQLPRLAVAPTKFVKGISRLTDPAESMQVMPLREALASEFATDAHFVSYSCFESGVESPSWPRLNKVVLDAIEAAGGRVFSTMLVIDYDIQDNIDANVYAQKKNTEGKVAWDDELIEDFWRRLDNATDAGLPMPNVVYTTAHGARCIYVLAEPVLVREVEDYYRGLVHLFGTKGLVADHKCVDWTRFFRMPRVMRDGAPSWTSPYFRLLEQWDSFVQLADLPKVEGVSGGDSYAPLKSIDRPRPQAEEAQAMLEVRGIGAVKSRSTALFKEAKRRLQGRNCFGCLFDMQPIAREGERDSKLTSYVGEAVAVLYYMDGCTPELVYALFMPAVEQLTPDAGNRNWLDKLWYLVCYSWAREVAKDEAREQKQKVVAVKTEDRLTAMLAGMRSWCKAPELEADDAHSIQWLLQHCICMTRAKRYHVLRPSGYFSRHGVPREHLVTEIRESGLAQFIELEIRENGGDPRALTPSELLARHGTQAHEVLGAANYPGSIIKNVATPDATLVLALYNLRRDLEPTFNDSVDIWLKKLAGEEHVQIMRDWIGFALDFEGGPICALSLSGPPACGKKMLVRGLAECINTGMVATGLDLVQKFPATLLKTPFLCVDEGLPSKVPGGLDIADQFRRVVSGESITLDVKFGDPVTVFNPLRVIFTANNLETVRAITSHRDLTPEDQAALSQRILHLDVKQGAADWLAANGGVRMTKGWIQGDAGEPSEYVVARHFLWLYEHRPKAPLGTRLLVEGNLESEVMRDMRTQSGVAPLVIRTLIYMIESAGKDHMQGLAIENGVVYVTASGVVQVYRADISNRRDLNSSQALTVLRSVSMPGGSKNPTYHVNAKGERLKARWHRLDLCVLLEEAYTNGYPSKNLEKLLREQYGSEADSIIEGLSK